MTLRYSCCNKSAEWWRLYISNILHVAPTIAELLRGRLDEGRVSLVMTATVNTPLFHDMFSHKQTVSLLTDNPFMRMIYLNTLTPQYEAIVQGKMPQVYHCHVTNTLGVEFVYRVKLFFNEDRTWKAWFMGQTTHRLCYTVAAITPKGSSYTTKQLREMTQNPGLCGLKGMQSDDD